MELKEVQEAIKLHRRKLHLLKNVVSVGTGEKITKGKKTGEYAIIVGVKQKLPLEVLADEDVVPETLGDCKTDVQRVKKIKLLEEPKQPVEIPLEAKAPPSIVLSTPQVINRKSRIRPAKGGYSIGNIAITAGTFGCVAYKQTEAVILSNAHVLTPDATEKVASATQIVQPGAYDGGKVPEDLIGNLIDYVPVETAIDFSQCSVSKRITNSLTKLAKKLNRQSRFYALAESGMVNYVDAAIAKPFDLISAEVEAIGIPVGIVDPKLGAKVKKSGRTTGLTEGVITQLDVSLTVTYGQEWFLPKIAYFEDQVIIEPLIVGDKFSQGGDSGSVIFCENESELLVCGLLFAGNEDGSITVANKISNVQDALDIRIGRLEWQYK